MRRVLASLALLSAAAAAGIAPRFRSAPDERARRAVRSALDDFERGALPGALAWAETAFAADATSERPVPGAAVLAAAARAVANDLPMAIRRAEDAARRTTADGEGAFSAALLHRAALRQGLGASHRDEARRWFAESVARADAASRRAPGEPGPRLLAAAALLASDDLDGAEARLVGLVAATDGVLEQRLILLAAVRSARGDFDGACETLGEVRPPSERIAAALARVEAWRRMARAPEAIQGLAALSAGEPAIACGPLERWIERHPGDAAASAALAAALVASNDADGVARVGAKLRAARPDGAAGPWFEAHVAMARGRPDVAARRTDLALAAAPASIPVLRLAVALALDAGDPARALRLTAESATGRSPDVLALRGAAHLAADDPEAAERCWRDATGIEPAHPHASDRLAWLLSSTGRHADAEAVATAACDADPRSAAARSVRARTRDLRGDGDAARADHEAALLLAPRDPAVLARAGVALLASDPRRGETLLETAVALDPGHEPAWHGLLAAAHSRGELSAFRERLRRVPGTLRGVAARSFVEGAAADLAGDADDAAACYARALAASPHHVGAANNLAWILAVRNGRPRDALPHAELAASLAPRSPEALDTLGWTRFLLGEPEAAEALLARARRLAPDRAPVALRHGRSLLGCGRRGEARAAFRDAARLDPRIAETGEFLEAAAKAALEIHR